MRRVLALLFLLSACDEPVGPQPDQPIRPPSGYVPDPGGPPPPKPAAPPPPKEVAVAPAQPPPPEPPKCPEEVATVLTAKAKPVPKDKRKRVALELGAKSADGPTIVFNKVVRTEEGVTEDVKAKGATLEAFVVPANAKSKVKVTLTVTCGWEERVLGVTVDSKGGVTMKQVPPPPEPGFLDVFADASTKVSVSGRELGPGPIKGQPLAPGKYVVKLTPKKGKPRMVQLEITSGRHTNIGTDPMSKR